MLQLEVNNMYINIRAKNGSEKLLTKNTTTSGKLIKAVYVSYVYVYIPIRLTMVVITQKLYNFYNIEFI
jgi:hypothetical protein